MKKCKMNEQIECTCAEQLEACPEILKHTKVVWCNDTECKFNIEIPNYKHEVYRGKNHKPFADDYFTGICGRSDIGLSRQRIRSEMRLGQEQKFTSCRVRSDKSLNRPKFPDPDKIEHTVFDEPKDSDFNFSAFGI